MVNSHYHVICFQQRLTHYREGFFIEIKRKLLDAGIKFTLVHGCPDNTDQLKNDAGYLSWAHVVTVKSYKILAWVGVWVPKPSNVHKPDLVIITQENKLLANYYWMINRLLTSTKVAFWGHGRNFQSRKPTGILERFKKRFIGRVDWWFAYTGLTKDILIQDGYPDSRITVVNNSIDNNTFANELRLVSKKKHADIRSVLGIMQSSPVGLFCGSLYADKRLEFLIESADAIRNSIPNFHLIVIGDGPSASEIEAAAESRPWVHWVGARLGCEKAAYFSLANIILNPGSVGLNILDSFCSGIPMVTTSDALHGPEFTYIQNNINGLVVDGDSDSYAKAVADLLNDPARYRFLSARALESSEIYTLEKMVDNFVSGVVRCLVMTKK